MYFKVANATGDVARSTPRPVDERPAIKTIPAAKPRMPGKAFFTPYRSAFVKVITTPGPGLATTIADIKT